MLAGKFSRVNESFYNSTYISTNTKSLLIVIAQVIDAFFFCYAITLPVTRRVWLLNEETTFEIFDAYLFKETSTYITLSPSLNGCKSIMALLVGLTPGHRLGFTYVHTFATIGKMANEENVPRRVFITKILTYMFATIIL